MNNSDLWLEKVASVILGVVFGVLLVSVGATDFDVMAGMFTLSNYQLPIVLSLGVITGAIGMLVVKRIKALSMITQKKITFNRSDLNTKSVIGAVLFGIGWAITLSCPGTAIVMIGEGKMIGLVVVLGIIIGTFIWGWYNPKKY